MLMATLSAAADPSGLAPVVRGSHASAEIIAEKTSVKPGESFDIALRFKIESGWHMYWTNPGDSGMPPRVQWNLPAGVTVSELKFPVPKRIDVGGGLTSFGYEDELVLLATVTTTADVKLPLELTGDVKWLVCKETCVSEKQSVALKLNNEPTGGAAAVKADFERWRAALPVPAPKNSVIELWVTHKGDAGSINVNGLPQGAKDADIFPPRSSMLEYGKPTMTMMASLHESVSLPFRILPGEVKNHSGDAVVAYTDKNGQRVGLLLKVEFKLEN
jgi:thiol:disulfide interchange protein DsbD